MICDRRSSAVPLYGDVTRNHQSCEKYTPSIIPSCPTICTERKSCNIMIEIIKLLIFTLYLCLIIILLHSVGSICLQFNKEKVKFNCKSNYNVIRYGLYVLAKMFGVTLKLPETKEGGDSSNDDNNDDDNVIGLIKCFRCLN